MCYLIEVWKSVENFPYEISNLGRVRNSKGRILNPNSAGQSLDYLKYDFRKDNRRFQPLEHVLVAQAFIDNPEGKPTVNHLESDRKDFNAAHNLEWATYAEQAAWKAAIAGIKLDGEGLARDESGAYI